MARNIGPTVDILLSRVRQSGGISITTNNATQILTICQQIVNIILKRKITTESFATAKSQLFYPMSDLASVIDIVSVSESSRELFECKRLTDFSAYEKGWFRNITGSRFEAWHQIGRDYFIIYPGKASASSVDIEYVHATAISSDYTGDYATALELPDEDIEGVLRLSEIILTLRDRSTDDLNIVIQHFMTFLESKDVDVKSKYFNAG